MGPRCPLRVRFVVALVCLLGTAEASRVPATPATPRAPTVDARTAIRKVIKKHLPQIFACFERDGLATTEVDVDFTVGISGDVTATRTRSTGSASLQRCVRDVFAKMRFAKQITPVRVGYPVHICVAGQ